MITPYWTSKDGRHVLYNADCMEVLPTLTGVDAVVTDPPYGIGRDGKPPSTSSHGGHKGYEFRGWDSVRPSREAFDQILKCATDCIIWGGNYFADYLPPSRCWLMWDKGQRIDQADGELAYTSLDMPVRIKILNRVALMQDGAVHPTQKPIAIIEWCLGFLPCAQVICDPFTGSGTTGMACIRTGCRFIGIEISREYCDIAIRRMERELSQPKLPGMEPERITQMSLLEAV